MIWTPRARVRAAILTLAAGAAAAHALPAAAQSPERAPPSVWSVNDGALLSHTLKEWALVSGWTVIWRLAENDDVRLAADARYNGDFPRAVIDLFNSLPPAARVHGELRADTAPPVLVVTRDSSGTAGRVRRLVASGIPPLAPSVDQPPVSTAGADAASTAPPSAIVPTPVANSSASLAAAVPQEAATSTIPIQPTPKGAALTVAAQVVTPPRGPSPVASVISPGQASAALAIPTAPQPAAPVAPERPAAVWDVQIADVNVFTTFDRWGRSAGWRVKWDAARHVLVDAPGETSGTFEDAVEWVLSSPGIAKSDYPLEVCFYQNKVARITRRGEQNEECK